MAQNNIFEIAVSLLYALGGESPNKRNKKQVDKFFELRVNVTPQERQMIEQQAEAFNEEAEAERRHS